MKGTITRIIMDKGFGFIKAGGIDYFFHRSTIDKDSNLFNHLREGQQVDFEIEEGAPRGPRASVVRVI